MTYHFMWLFDSKLHETFSGVTIDRKWCETHERNDINTHLHYQARASNLHTLKHKMTRYVEYVLERCFKHIPYIHVALACFICFTSALHMFHAHIWTMMLMLMQCKCQKRQDNTRGVAAFPLKRISSRDSGRKTFKGREACYPFSNIYDSTRLFSFKHQRG
jgi:hypothetical protein